MTGKTFRIEVHDDHLAKIGQTRRPVLALAELIWNAVDADATQVEVTLEEDGLGGINAIRVTDDGHGIPFDEAENLFSRLGGSWKRKRLRSIEGKRILHGKDGKGRFRAFSLGDVVEWDVCAPASGDDFISYSITMGKDDLRRVTITDATPTAERQRGVSVTVSEIAKDFRLMSNGDVADHLTHIFALYLRQYPAVRINYGGTRLDFQAMEDRCATYELPNIETEDGQPAPVSLEIVEWRLKARRKLFICDAHGFPLEETSPGIQAPGFTFTAYLKSDYFADLFASNMLDLASMDPNVDACLIAAKEAMRKHFRRRSSENAVGLVEGWRTENVYPFDDEPTTVIERIEREVFDVLALNLNTYLPDFQSTAAKTKRLQFRLLRHAISRAPTDLARIITEVLDLPKEKRDELTRLLDRTTLSAIIGASRLVADRLDFLRGLETILFDRELQGHVRERGELHRIVADNAWLFGEQYHLAVDDQSLTEVLKKHLELAGREVAIDGSVQRTDGSRGIVDLMFSRNIQVTGAEEREHLVVELKRPSVKIDSAAAVQIKSYAVAVAEDERFRDAPVRWTFWAVSNEVDEMVRRDTRQRGRAQGILMDDGDEKVTVWVKTWSQIINECKARLQFFEEKLKSAPDRDSSLQYLSNTYRRYLGDVLAEVGPSE